MSCNKKNNNNKIIDVHPINLTTKKSRNNASNKQASRTWRMKCSHKHCTHHTTARDSLPVSLNELQVPCDNLPLPRKLDDIYPPINSCYRQKICQITKDTCWKMNEDGGQNFRAKRKHWARDSIQTQFSANRPPRIPAIFP